MIYTVTLNPSVDVFVSLDELKLGELNRALGDRKIPGGKAINVSRTLNNMEIPTIATGFLGGFTGDYIKDYFDEKGINNTFIEVRDDTRINIKLLEGSRETLINGLGPKIEKDEFNDFLYYLSRVGEGDFVIMGGSIPVNAPEDIYDRIIRICETNDAHFVLDIGPNETKMALSKKPLLVLETVEDLEAMFDMEINSIEDCVRAGEKCVEMGAKNVLIPYDKKGAILTTSYGSFRTSPLTGEIINPLSAKDAMLAAWIGTYVRRNDEVDAFRFASRALSVTAFVDDLPTREQIENAAERIEVIQIR